MRSHPTPEKYLDPVTEKLMSDPVLANIKGKYRIVDRSTLTINDTDVTTFSELQKEIQEWQKKNYSAISSNSVSSARNSNPGSYSQQAKLKTEVDYLLTYRFLGLEDVGKTSLLNRFIDDTFTESSIPTVVDFKTKTLDVLDVTTKLKILESAADESRRGIINRANYKGCQAAIIVSDLSDRATCFGVSVWLQDFQQNKSDVKYVLIIQNKVDLVSSKKDIKSMFENDREFVAKWNNDAKNTIKVIGPCLTSAKTGEGVREAFVKLTEAVLIGRGHKVVEEKNQSSDNKPGGYTIS